ncbi:MAG: biotin-dependent carboxyltransferase family protein [Siculibacillus sp.]|nr:biotin-dependent carboxyltransferase family protein [Siculibacillus sp.]
MNPALRILAAGPGATVQDAGRPGFSRWGVTGCGAMDPVALRIANRALGGGEDAAAIEIPLGGLEVTAESEALDVAVVGGDFDVRLDGRRLPGAVALRLAPGARLAIRAGASGAFAYLAVAGTLDVPAVLGSRATHTRSHLGGLDGRMLRAGDHLAVSRRREVVAVPAAIEAAALAGESGPVRVVLGPQADHFEAEEIAAFLSRDWRLSPRSDRMAYTLDGPPLVLARGHDIVSDAVTHGAIQVPGSGSPFVLMADRQPTGGYPKIATVIGADLGRMAQIRPGEPVRFAAVPLEAAVAARRLREERLAAPVRLVPLVRSDFTTADLLGLDLVSGVVDARTGQGR